MLENDDESSRPEPPEPTTRKWCVVGLGNPGAEYRDTRHNIGFMVIDGIAREWNVPKMTFRNNYYAAEGRFKGQDVLLCKPWTYMNCSGEAITDIMEQEMLHPERLFVVADDVALPAGVLRLRTKGSSGGHNGLQSIIQSIGTAGFPRLRCGIGAPDPDMDLAEYVLSPFAAEEQACVHAMILQAVRAVSFAIESGFDAAMNTYNTVFQPPEADQAEG